MKKIISLSLSGVVLMTLLTGCLKDKGFDDNKYGLNSPENSAVGAGFAESKAVVSNYFVDYKDDPQTVQGLAVKLMSDVPLGQDVQVSFTVNNDLITHYNDSIQALDPTDPGLAMVPAGVYSIPSYSITIPAGKMLSYGNIIFTGAGSGLSTDSTYAIGFTVTSVNGVQVAENYRNIIVTVQVKNTWDGIYTLHGYFFHPTQPGYVGTFTRTDIELRTYSGNQVVMYWQRRGDFSHPFSNNGTITSFANQAPIYTIDPATNAVTAVDNYWLSAGGVPYMIDPSYPGGNRYDPATKTFYVQYKYNSAGGDRQYTDTLVYTGPR